MTFDHDSLTPEFQPFSRLLALLEALPTPLHDTHPLRSAIPAGWPTVGDLRALVAALRRDDAARLLASIALLRYSLEAYQASYSEVYPDDVLARVDDLLALTDDMKGTPR
jgi:hypothetical protein